MCDIVCVLHPTHNASFYFRSLDREHNGFVDRTNSAFALRSVRDHLEWSTCRVPLPVAVLCAIVLNVKNAQVRGAVLESAIASSLVRCW